MIKNYDIQNLIIKGFPSKDWEAGRKYALHEECNVYNFDRHVTVSHDITVEISVISITEDALFDKAVIEYCVKVDDTAYTCGTAKDVKINKTCSDVLNPFHTTIAGMIEGMIGYGSFSMLDCSKYVGMNKEFRLAHRQSVRYIAKHDIISSEWELSEIINAVDISEVGSIAEEIAEVNPDLLPKIVVLLNEKGLYEKQMIVSEHVPKQSIEEKTASLFLD